MTKVEKSALPILLSGLALTAAGCGGGNSVADKYANGVCTAIGTWVTAVKPLMSGPHGNVTQAEGKLKRFEAATNRLATQIEGVPAPNAPADQAGRKEIGRLATQIQRTAADVKVTVANVGRNASLSAPALRALAQQFELLQTTTQATLASLNNGGGELAGAFGGSSACKQLG